MKISYFGKIIGVWQKYCWEMPADNMIVIENAIDKCPHSQSEQCQDDRDRIDAGIIVEQYDTPAKIKEDITTEKG